MKAVRLRPTLPFMLLPLALAAQTPALAQSQPPADLMAAAAPQVIVVSATRHAMALVDAPASIEVVTPEQIHQRGADNLFDAIRGNTGISTQGRTISGRKAINLRGMDSRHTLVLVDGKRIGASDGVIGHSDFQYDWIAADDIDRIEVIRGPMSVLYGAEALGGVVNVITRAPGTQRWRVGAQLEGSWADDGRGGDGQRAALQADGPLAAGVQLAVSAAESRRQAVAGTADTRVSDLEGRHKRDAALRLHWQPAAGHEVVAEHRVGDELRWAVARERSGAKRYYSSDSSLDRTHSSLGWTWAGGGALDLRTQLRAYRSTLDTDNLRNNGVASLRPQSLDDRVAEGQVSLTPAAGHTGTGGFEVRREVLHNVGLPGGSGRAEHQALYLQHEAELARALTLTAGLRWDHHSRFGHEWSPRAYLVWQAAPGWTVKGGVGTGFKAPTLKQISPDYREDEGPYTYVGNAALRPETNQALELGGGWSGAAAGVQLMAFRNDVKDLIVSRLIGVQAGRQTYVFENTERGRLQGLEANASWRVGAGFTVGGSWQGLSARDDHGQRLEKRPRQLWSARLDWAAGALRAGVRVDRQHDQLLAPLVVGQALQAVPDVTLVSAHAGIGLGHGLDLSLGVNNATNVNLAAKSPLFIYAEAPRTWRLALRGRW